MGLDGISGRKVHLGRPFPGPKTNRIVTISACLREACLSGLFVARMGDSTTWFDVEIQIDESYPRGPSTELRRSYCLSASIAMLDWMFTKKDRHGAWG